MKIIKSSKAMNYIHVAVEKDINTDYLWQWGGYAQILNVRGEYLIYPTNDEYMNFQTCLENLAKITNEVAV